MLALNRALGCRFLAVSKEIATSFERTSIESGRVIVSDNAVDMEMRDLRSAMSLRQKLGWTGKTVVGIFGRLAPQKGHHDLLAALMQGRAEHDELRCLVVGSGELMDDLVARTEELGLRDRVRFIPGPR
ncbi:MAG: glycosyltransferase [Rhizobiales bacterium]|nr:glycosyltransferase [Hyphomicrobiales bacterium]